MSAKLDMVIIGAGPGGIAAGLLAARNPKSCLILEKGRHVMQGIVETYPKGKKVYPTLPKNHTAPFPVMELKPPDLTSHVILAFGSNIPNDLGIYGEARTVARRIENGEDYIGIHVLVIGGGNAAADVVSSLSKIKREANDPTDVYWAHIKERFEINTDTARDLGEEILLGGHIKILQRAVPKIGEVDADGIDRLYIHQAVPDR